MSLKARNVPEAEGRIGTRKWTAILLFLWSCKFSYFYFILHICFFSFCRLACPTPFINGQNFWVFLFSVLPWSQFRIPGREPWLAHLESDVISDLIRGGKQTGLGERVLTHTCWSVCLWGAREDVWGLGIPQKSVTQDWKQRKIRKKIFNWKTGFLRLVLTYLDIWKMPFSSKRANFFCFNIFIGV